ncbi:SHOCT domain-containing protein [Longispora sp. K20-0274]|uniref:SHOCT domain-containing protein n=1 Tax=Longispora sp. K20-0274 TaxID=3088255 RepID=UPI003999FE43
MKFYVRSVAGIALLVVGLAVFLFGIYQVAKGGTCSSGGVHVSTKQCAPGSTGWMFALPVILLAGLGGLWLWSRRGPRPGTVAPVPPVQGFRYTSGAVLQGVPGTDPIARLEQLRVLRDAGVLTPAEFEAAKATVLGRL